MLKFEANCVNCSKMYMSEGACSDFGNCPSCNEKKMNRIRNNWKAAFVNPKKKVKPVHLGEDKLQQIRVFYNEMRGVLWKKRNASPAIINKHFGLNLTHKEVDSITNRATMKNHGFQLEYKIT